MDVDGNSETTGSGPPGTYSSMAYSIERLLLGRTEGIRRAEFTGRLYYKNTPDTDRQTDRLRYVGMYTYIYIYTYVDTCICISLTRPGRFSYNLSGGLAKYVCTYKDMCIYIYVYTHTRKHVYIYIHIHIYIYIYICVCMHASVTTKNHVRYI